MYEDAYLDATHEDRHFIPDYDPHEGDYRTDMCWVHSQEVGFCDMQELSCLG